MSNIPPRPQWNDPEVKALAVPRVHDAVRDWCLGNGTLAEDHDPKEFTAFLTAALIDSPDSYQCGRYFDDNLDAPTDAELVRILDEAYRAMPYLVKEIERDWVMETGVRFEAKKDDIVVFRVGGAELKGRVIGIERDRARGIVAVQGGKGQVLPVTAETILDISKPKKKPVRDPGGTVA